MLKEPLVNAFAIFRRWQTIVYGLTVVAIGVAMQRIYLLCAGKVRDI